MINQKKLIYVMFLFVIIFTIFSSTLANTYSIKHKIQPGESLFFIAQRYGSNIESIKEANNLTGDTIKANDSLLIPVNSSNSSFKATLIWPVKGRISSGYGNRTHPIRGTKHFHGGIDIAVPAGTKIKAVSAGTVVWSGWVQGFGQTIVIDHENGYKTLYGHNSRLLVSSGARVHGSQVIALAGSTGNSTGSHLDFRIYLNENTVNPLNYLP